MLSMFWALPTASADVGLRAAERCGPGTISTVPAAGDGNVPPDVVPRVLVDGSECNRGGRARLHRLSDAGPAEILLEQGFVGAPSDVLMSFEYLLEPNSDYVLVIERLDSEVFEHAFSTGSDDLVAPAVDAPEILRHDIWGTTDRRVEPQLSWVDGSVRASPISEYGLLVIESDGQRDYATSRGDDPVQLDFSRTFDSGAPPGELCLTASIIDTGGDEVAGDEACSTVPYIIVRSGFLGCATAPVRAKWLGLPALLIAALRRRRPGPV